MMWSRLLARSSRPVAMLKNSISSQTIVNMSVAATPNHPPPKEACIPLLVRHFTSPPPTHKTPQNDVPEAIDWRKEGAVTGVNNQCKYCANQEEEDGAKWRKQFEDWMVEYNRVYNTQEEKEHRFKIFKMNAECINSYNARPGLMYTRGVHRQSDMTDEELHQLGASRASVRTFKQ